LAAKESHDSKFITCNKGEHKPLGDRGRCPWSLDLLPSIHTRNPKALNLYYRPHTVLHRSISILGVQKVILLALFSERNPMAWRKGPKIAKSEEESFVLPGVGDTS
jgi:hypothetical protein